MFQKKAREEKTMPFFLDGEYGVRFLQMGTREKKQLFYKLSAKEAKYFGLGSGPFAR